MLELFAAACDRVAALLARTDDWGSTGARDGQYRVDVEADAASVGLLHRAGLAVLSEESGVTAPGIVDDGAIVVVDPLDGSTNAALGLPWCATSLCLVVDGVATVAMVSNLRTGARFAAVRGSGATLDGRPLSVAEPVALREAIIAVNGRPVDGFRPAQFRAMGATALDLATVGAGGFDGSVDFDDDRIGVWDYLAAVLIVEEAGGVAVDALGRDLVTLDHAARRRPVTASSPQLLDELLTAAEP